MNCNNYNQPTRNVYISLICSLLSIALLSLKGINHALKYAVHIHINDVIKWRTLYFKTCVDIPDFVNGYSSS